MKPCPICGEMVPPDAYAGDVCQACADRYDAYGVYFCLGAGSPWVIAHPGFPQIRTCAIDASGSSYHGFAT